MAFVRDRVATSDLQHRIRRTAITAQVKLELKRTDEVPCRTCAIECHTVL